MAETCMFDGKPAVAEVIPSHATEVVGYICEDHVQMARERGGRSKIRSVGSARAERPDAGEEKHDDR